MRATLALIELKWFISEAFSLLVSFDYGAVFIFLLYQLSWRESLQTGRLYFSLFLKRAKIYPGIEAKYVSWVLFLILQK